MRACEVYVNGTIAGILKEYDNPREYVFKYNKEYLDSRGDAISLAMPLCDSTFKSPNLFPFFFNMLSEGENRALQASLLHLDIDDDFGILLATATHDTVGAVTVKPIDIN